MREARIRPLARSSTSHEQTRLARSCSPDGMVRAVVNFAAFYEVELEGGESWSNRKILGHEDGAGDERDNYVGEQIIAV